jgi:hypothetical protein
MWASASPLFRSLPAESLFAGAISLAPVIDEWTFHFWCVVFPERSRTAVFAPLPQAGRRFHGFGHNAEGKVVLTR